MRKPFNLLTVRGPLVVATTVGLTVLASAGSAGAATGIGSNVDVVPLNTEPTLLPGQSVQKYRDYPITATGELTGNVRASGTLAAPGGLSVRGRACDRAWSSGGHCPGIERLLADSNDLSKPLPLTAVPVTAGTTVFLRFDLGLPSNLDERFQKTTASVRGEFVLPSSNNRDRDRNQDRDDAPPHHDKQRKNENRPDHDQRPNPHHEGERGQPLGTYGGYHGNGGSLGGNGASGSATRGAADGGQLASTARGQLPGQRGPNTGGGYGTLDHVTGAVTIALLALLTAGLLSWRWCRRRARGITKP